ncbi:MAG: type II secretion system F family protein [Candidatus Omnitrophica bacterium]|nr:type II secretion system F family protein [Candidatus Omnitrophota bacterium]
MILLVSLCLFFTFFSVSWAFSRAVQRSHDEVTERLIRRLRDDPEDRQMRVHLERDQRLSNVPFLDRILRKINPIKNFQSWIRQSGLSLSPGILILISLLLGMISFLLFTYPRKDFGSAIIFTPLFMAIPFGFVALAKNRRTKKFSEDFPDAISRMASSLRAGYSLQMALDAVIEDGGTGVVVDEFRKVRAEMELGQSFEEALKKMIERVDTTELRLFICSVIIQRESGGNLAELLDNLESTIRQRFELQRELQSATAQARLSGIVLSFLPVFVGFFVYFIHPDYVLFLFNDPVGIRLFWMCVAGQIMGVFTIKKIVDIKI